MLSSASSRAATEPLGQVDPAVGLSRQVMEQLLGPAENRSVRVVYWDGSADPPVDAPVTLRLNWPGALRRMLLPPTDLSVGEAYVYDDIDFVGDVESAVRSGWERVQRLAGPGEMARLTSRLLRLPRRRAASADRTGNGEGARPGEASAKAGVPGGDGRVERTRTVRGGPGRKRDARAVRFHYDVGNDFFRLFLDERMQYSCGYFQRPGAELDEAQRAKLDLICRKLRLREGERLLDVGCGWGGLLIHAARHYGAKATGITLSHEQAALARAEIARLGLEDRCRVEIRDYRELDGDGCFDKIASVGMIEHVGLRRYPAYFRAVHRLLRPGGLFLNHGIVHLRRGHTRRDWLKKRIERRQSFIHRHIFPGSELLPLAPTLTRAERVGFEVRDVESLREHYARTLRAWVRRLEGRWEEARQAVGEPTARAWRFYMAASAHLFDSGYIGVVQTLLARPGVDGRVPLPATREDLYVGAAEDGAGDAADEAGRRNEVRPVVEEGRSA